MDDNVLNLELDDNVGNGLAKINYNLLNINQDSCELNQYFIDNAKFLNSVENLMDNLDTLIPKINYDFLEKLEASVQVLSSYWDKLEFTVQYPFNPINGFISSIVNAGEFGSLTSFDNENQQKNLLAETMVKIKFYNSKNEALDGINDRDVVFVTRNDNGVFTSWDYMTDDLIFGFSVDRENNFYYNTRLVDLYKLPYYSVITPKNVNLSLDATFVDFDDKILRQGGNALNPDKRSITNNSYINYSVLTNREVSETEEPLDVTKFTPIIRNLNEIIANNNPVYKAKIAKINDDTLESILQNPFLNTTCLKFLNKSYAPQKYLDGTIINVCLFLYNTLGLDTATATIRTDYFAANNTTTRSSVSTAKLKRKKNELGVSNDTVTVVGDVLNKIESIQEEDVTRTAPSSNTTFDVAFRKTDVYVERITLVKYVKKSKLEFVTNKLNGKVTSKVTHYWEFVSANIGPKYSRNDNSVKRVDTAPVYVRKTPTVSEILSFPTQIVTETGDIINNKQGNTFLIDNVR
jgi:hypothetical protein